MPFIHGRPDGYAIEATPRGRRNYPPDGAVPLGGVKLDPAEPDLLYCTCADDCPDACPGDLECVGFCEACHFLRLRAEEDGTIEGAGKTRQ